MIELLFIQIKEGVNIRSYQTKSIYLDSKKNNADTDPVQQGNNILNLY